MIIVKDNCDRPAYIKEDGSLVEANGQPYEITRKEALEFLEGGAEAILNKYGEYSGGKAEQASGVVVITGKVFIVERQYGQEDVMVDDT